MKDQYCKIPRWILLKAELNNLNPAEFSQKLAAADSPILIDVRTEKEFTTGHLDHAININYFAEDFWDQVEKLDHQRDLFVYCRTGRRSTRACTLMKNGGFDPTRLYNMDGGYLLWLKEGK
ncbi:MAG: rhodanese-like domain-containing protein [Bacteroidota bacterium]